MELGIISWNVRGINEGNKHSVIKFFIRMTRLTLFVFKK